MGSRHEKLNRLPVNDPIGGGPLYVREVSTDDGDITIRGHFQIPRWCRLDPEQERFLETFLRCRGVLSAVEREMGISYPTVRSRLDGLLAALELTPVKEDERKDRMSERRAKVLEQLEKGEITPEEAKRQLKEVGR